VATVTNTATTTTVLGEETEAVQRIPVELLQKDRIWTEYFKTADNFLSCAVYLKRGIALTKTIVLKQQRQLAILPVYLKRGIARTETIVKIFFLSFSPYLFRLKPKFFT